MALGHCLGVSAHEASSPAVLAKGKCLAYVALAVSTGASFASTAEPMAPRAEPPSNPNQPSQSNQALVSRIRSSLQNRGF
jgi:hypothetical protein